jgi:mitogen-activated protein kinase kinase 5
MAPERILGGQYGVHSEVWSLGVTILEIALGYYPFRKSVLPSEGMLAIELLQCIVSEEPPQLPSDEFSPACVDFLSQWYAFPLPPSAVQILPFFFQYAEKYAVSTHP